MSNKMRILLSEFVLLIFLFIGCSNDNSSTNADKIPECTGNVEISVSSGTKPVFSWTPECKIYLLLVENTSNGSDVWGIKTEGSNSIAPSVTYGSIPKGAEILSEENGTLNLISGTEYRVILFTYAVPDSLSSSIIGISNFMP